SHTDIEFMWLCQQHRIYCLYILPHLSHILQPLDLAAFSVTKSKYRKQIQALASLDDAAPVKKERFISSYYQARVYGLSERGIQAGLRATWLVPYDPERVLSSSQVLARPVTPARAPQLPSISDIAFQTPQKPQDLYRAQQLLQRSETLSRSTRLVLSK